MKKSAMRNVVLAVLSDGPKTAHGVLTELEGQIGDFWELRDGAIRLLLQTAEKSGLVSTHVDDRGRREFSLTEAGQAVVVEWRTDTVADMRPHRDELILRLLHGGRAPELAAYIEDRLHLNARQVAEIQRRLRREAPDSVDPAMFELVLHAVLAHCDADHELLVGAQELLASGRAETRSSRSEDHDKAVG